MAELSPTEISFVTFYSFKGGVGRSMALINVAGILAGRGFRVLAMDMDLEAPGISFLRDEQRDHPGFVDVLYDAVDRGSEADLFTLAPAEVVERYTYHYELPEAIRQVDEGQLRIMPAGRFDDGDYQARLDRLALGTLYRDGNGKPLIDAFKTVIREAGLFDLVLIDSRTGFSDESGVCTRDLGDHLVVVMGLNHQNVEGTAAFFEALRVSGVRPKGLTVVLSPVPNGEDDLVDEREAVVAERLSRAWHEPLVPHLQIPYHPRLALTEEPHIFRRSRGYLYEAYRRLERAVIGMLGYRGGEIQREIRTAGKKGLIPRVIRGIELLGKVGAGDSEFGVVLELENLWLAPDNVELRAVLLRWLPKDGYVLKRLAMTMAENGVPDADQLMEDLLVRYDSDDALIGTYAVFLEQTKHDYDRAEVMYKRALELGANESVHLFSYAIFLGQIRRDYANAERLFEIVAANFKEEKVDDWGDWYGNYAQMLFSQGADDRAREMLAQALEADEKSNSLECELYFYACAHASDAHPDALGKLKEHLVAGHRSKGWNLNDNVRAAREAGHPSIEFIEALARVVSDHAPIETLNEFEQWRQGRLDAVAQEG